jgi:hypothetical protein
MLEASVRQEGAAGAAAVASVAPAGAKARTKVFALKYVYLTHDSYFKNTSNHQVKSRTLTNGTTSN